MCLGAAAARGDVLLFLRADSTLQSGVLDRIDEVLSADATIIDRNFRLVFDGDTRFSRWLTRFCGLIRSLGRYYGDSGIFVRRSVYDALDGDRVPGRGVRAASVSRSPAGLAGVVRLSWRAA
jgi:hypothetical protein